MNQNGTAGPSGGQASHGTLAEELRLLLDSVFDRIPAAQREADEMPVTCGWCPVCAALAVLRGERPELGSWAGEHAAEMVASLRAVLVADHSAAHDRWASEPDHSAARAPVRVQHIAVRQGKDQPDLASEGTARDGGARQDAEDAAARLTERGRVQHIAVHRGGRGAR